MNQTISRLSSSPLFDGLIFLLLFLVLLADRYTVPGFAHGILYAPILMLASVGASIRRLTITFITSLLFVWSGIVIIPASLEAILQTQFIANRVLATLALMTIYLISSFTIRSQQQQSRHQHQLKLAADIAKLGYWQLGKSGQLHLSPEAAQILNQHNRSTISQSQFVSLFVDKQQNTLHQALNDMLNQQSSMDGEFSLIGQSGPHRIRIFSCHNEQLPNQIQGVIQDVHDSKLVEASLHEEQLRSHYMAENTLQFMWTVTAEGILDSVSPFTLEYFGKSETYVLNNWLELVHPDDKLRVHERWLHSMKTGDAYSDEFRLRRFDDEYMWFLAQANAIRDEQNQIAKWYGWSTNIHQIKILQQQSEALSQQLQNTLDSITDAFFTLSTDLRFSYLNNQATALFNMTRSRLLDHKGIENTDIDPTGSLVKKLSSALLQQQVMSFEHFYDAKKLWLDVRIYPSTSGLTVYLRDISRHRRESEELKLLRSAVSQLNDVVIITEAPRNPGEKPNIVFVNSAFERITGYNRQEVIGKTLKVLHGPKTEKNELRKIEAAYKTWQPIRAQLTQYHKSGREIVLELNSVPIGLTAGWYTHWVSVERDITEERQLQKQLQLAQRMEAIGQLTGGIAHDFNNLLTVITGNSDLLIDELNDKPSLQPLVRLISSAAERGAGLTRNLLAFARRQPLSPEAVNINMLIRNMEALLRSSLGQKYQLELSLSSDLWPVMIDPVQLESSLLNLTLNARDAMADGGTLTISTERFVLLKQQKTSANDLNAGEYVKIDVLDTGDGISQDLLDKVFEPFFTTKPAGKGSGLGLSMVFGFIKQSGGNIQVQSEVGQGTRFQLFIPHTDMLSPAPVLHDIETPVQVENGQQTILVVEDNDLVRQYALSQLRDAGYQVLAAADGNQALNWLASVQQIDLLFTDVLMPGGLTGYELAQKAKQLRNNLPVLFTSGYTEKVLTEEQRQNGSIAILNKPYHRAALLNRVAQMLVK
ncbi:MULTISPECIES: PAS domain-containing sensor histidine kinase [unclassified Methylophaga]|jgi:PAS domain S-box-containing protein|uniref:hybrid sensor histidine kinase/response regulator n=1 Tax=unclassified Methylophaga TaxID=2629249 RepID=UPI000C92F268|nr:MULTISPECIES: PAS domain S-box protein [unclassified Methylophaga]MAK66079.1 hybrid sensor histidine kinase/response regulator [Methylophaga sp.]MAY17275.1 hybrid sensor histidine kinase/response regulator [Methylophaga sp.]HCD06186.1 hybrid sensor histidine kinase/response regulator [Methylophaga sp.]|tara:strand:+ start:46977 stop:49940 length:2964 start_codon:yes stop_codon:yes gene_type:complete